MASVHEVSERPTERSESANGLVDVLALEVPHDHEGLMGLVVLPGVEDLNDMRELSAPVAGASRWTSPIPPRPSSFVSVYLPAKRREATFSTVSRRT